eukprot:m.871438 g.871438  ORF g.871438 m.871438 type:complete len:160 (-) comp59762_c0_seq13:131-610(-)
MAEHLWMLATCLFAAASALLVTDPYPLFPPADVCRQSFLAAGAYKESIGLRVAVVETPPATPQCVSYADDAVQLDRLCDSQKKLMWWYISDGKICSPLGCLHAPEGDDSQPLDLIASSASASGRRQQTWTIDADGHLRLADDAHGTCVEIGGFRSRPCG